MGTLDALVGSLITSSAVILYYPSHPWNFGLYSMIYVVVASSSCSSWRTIMILSCLCLCLIDDDEWLSAESPLSLTLRVRKGLKGL